VIVRVFEKEYFLLQWLMARCHPFCRYYPNDLFILFKQVLIRGIEKKPINQIVEALQIKKTPIQLK